MHIPNKHPNSKAKKGAILFIFLITVLYSDQVHFKKIHQEIFLEQFYHKPNAIKMVDFTHHP